MSNHQIYYMGPAGGVGGDPFTDEIIPDEERVWKVEIREKKSRIISVQIIFKALDGTERPSLQHGKNGGELRTFILEKNEYIIGISGQNGTRINSLTIQTNMKTSPTYGGPNGGRNGESTFRFQAPEGTHIVGFWGRAGYEVDALGVALRKR